MSQQPVTVELRSALPEATHAPEERGVRSGGAAVIVTLPDFMDPDYLEDLYDLMSAKGSIALAGSLERMSWEDLKEQIGL